MTISLRLNEEDALLIKKYAELNRISVSDLIRQTVMEQIETEYDLEMFDKAVTEYKRLDWMKIARVGRGESVGTGDIFYFISL